MLHVIPGDRIGDHRQLAESMFELRYSVFVERLGWKLDCRPGREVDQFDHPGAIHLVVSNPRRQAVASCRMLPTTAPNLLCDIFPYLARDGRPPVDSRIWEASRLAVDTRPDRLEGCDNVCGELLAGIMEFACHLGLSHLVSVSDRRVERILKRAGWQLARLGEPHRMDGFDVMGEITEVSTEALERVRNRCNVTDSLVPHLEDIRRAA